MIRRREYTLMENETVISDFPFYYATVLGVIREGQRLYSATGASPVSYEYKHSPTAGTITLSYSDSGSGETDIRTQKVIVIIKP